MKGGDCKMARHGERKDRSLAHRRPRNNTHTRRGRPRIASPCASRYSRRGRCANSCTHRSSGDLPGTESACERAAKTNDLPKRRANAVPPSTARTYQSRPRRKAGTSWSSRGLWGEAWGSVAFWTRPGRCRARRRGRHLDPSPRSLESSFRGGLGRWTCGARGDGVFLGPQSRLSY